MPLVLPVCSGLTMEQKQQQKSFSRRDEQLRVWEGEIKAQRKFYGSQPQAFNFVTPLKNC